MKTKLSLSVLLSFYFCLLSSQVPQGFNYQAIARDGAGVILANQPLTVKISIQPSLSNGSEFWIETHSVTTDQFGVMVFVIGNGTWTGGSFTVFSDIPWGSQTMYLKTEIDKGAGYLVMGTTQLWSVPYSMVAGDLKGSLKQLEVDGKTADNDPALFEVKNKDGNIVFAVYNEGVRVYVDNGQAKTAKGGFAIGGFGSKSGDTHEYLRVDPGNINMYIDDISTGKSAKGGFAIGGFGSKGSSFFNVDASDVTTVSANRVLWYPLKNAFLAGNVLINDPANVGLNSFATGNQSVATGQYSQAMGYQAVALGDYSTSIGNLSIAGARLNGASTASNAFAFGNAAKATGPGSYAFGDGAIASGPGSFSFGSVGRDTITAAPTGTYTTALGPYSFALGQGSQTNGTGAISLGMGNTSGGDYSASVGYNNQSTKMFANSFGAYNTASGPYSTAMGFGANTTGSGSIAIGNSQSVGSNSIAIGMGVGHLGNPGWFANCETDGIRSVAIGTGVTASSFASFVVGQQNEIPNPLPSINSWVDTDPLFVIGNGNGGDDGVGPHRSNAVTVLKSGRVGIGTSTPGARLEVGVSGTNMYAGIGINSSLSGGKLITLNQGEAGKLKFTGLNGVFSDNLVTFDFTSDNVGIGTTSPSYSLHAYGTNAALIAHYNGQTRGGISALSGQRLALLTTASSDNIVFGYTSTDQTNFSTNFVEQMRIVTGTGNVGIGTTTPAKKLSVNGDAQVSGDMYIGGGYSSLYNLFSLPFIQQGWTGGWGNYTALNSSWKWENNIGSIITCENYPLFVAKGSSGSPYQTTMLSVDMSGNVNMPYVYSHAVGVTHLPLYIDNTGYIGYLSSSARYKQNISEMENTNWLYNLRPVNFTYKSDSLNIRQYGLIAEEVEQVNPLFVIYNKEGKPESVNYDMLISPLLKAAQDQEHKIESLSNENQALKSQLQALHEKIDQIEALLGKSGIK